MTSFFYYLLKVILCSGVLFTYYHLALRNRLFHRWNRFYLLTAVALSILLPLLQVRLTTADTDASQVWRLIQSLQQADNTLEEFIVVSGNGITPDDWGRFVFLLISGILLFRFLRSLWHIQQIIRSHTVRPLQGIYFVNTMVPGTPFSFFRYIFWNNEISLQSDTGQHIFQHEKVHVEENHTADKLFLQLVLLFFWCNPFFWLIRKELAFVHEFIADQKAVDNKNTEAFAAMILQAAYPQQFSSIINPFFQNAIKRRITMLTKEQKPGLNYLSRLIILPLLTLIVFAFTVRTGPVGAAPGASENVREALSVLRPFYSPVTDTVPQKKKEISAIDVRKDKEKMVGEITITYTDGTTETLSGEEAEKRGLINKKGKTRVSLLSPQDGVSLRLRDTGDNRQPLYILNGKEISKADVEKIDPNKIESINVLKDDSAKEKYGEKGKNGVIEITMKPGAEDISSESELSQSNTSQPKGSNENIIFSQAEVPASIDPGEWRKFLEQAIQPIIKEVGKKAPNGTYTVRVRFMVNTDGRLSEYTLVEDPGYSIGEQVLPMMKKAPNWKPAMQNGHPVRSYHTQPFTFVITGSPVTTGIPKQQPIGPQQVKNLTLHQLAGLSASDEIVSCELSLDTDEGDIAVAINKGNSLNEQSRRLLSAATQGKLLTIDDIVVRKNGETVKMPSKAYNL